MKKLTLFIIVVLILGGITYYVYSKRPQNTVPMRQQQTSISPTSTESSALDTAAVSEVTSNFYKEYDSCMKNPPAAAAGKVSVYCQNNSGLTTAAFAANLDKGGTSKAGADPIFCAQNPPESITVNPDTQITADKAVAYISEVFGQMQIKIQADLLKYGDTWKIDNIICPLP